jgi:hypothetical protein
MAFQKVEYELPKAEERDIEIESSSAIEVDIGGRKAKAKAKEAEAEAEEEVELEDDDAEYDVEVVDDTPKADRNRKPSEPPEEITDDELEDYSDKVRKRIQHFSKGYHDERRAKESALREREELERLTQKLVDENKELKGSVNKNQTALLEQAKRSATADHIAAKKAYKDAYEAGDADGVLNAQESLSNAKNKVDRLNNFWFNQDIEMTSFALGLHNKLVHEGVSPQSDDYYERIDTRMRQLFPEKFEDSEEVQKPKRRSNVVAPATRSTAPKKIRLTQTQYQLSKRLGLTPEQYAKQVALDMRKQ